MSGALAKERTSCVTVAKTQLHSLTQPTNLVSGQRREQTAQACAKPCLQQAASQMYTASPAPHCDMAVTLVCSRDHGAMRGCAIKPCRTTRPLPSHPDTAAGLEHLVTDMLSLPGPGARSVGYIRGSACSTIRFPPAASSLPVSFISRASSASITGERTASRRRPAFSSHLFTPGTSELPVT
jgi:hypothetical protein